jgi:hypothetical protein
MLTIRIATTLDLIVFKVLLKFGKLLEMVKCRVNVCIEGYSELNLKNRDYIWIFEKFI